MRTLECSLKTQYHQRIPDFFIGDTPAQECQCFAGVSFADIDYQGNLYLCVEGSAALGNIHHNTFAHLWKRQSTQDKSGRFLQTRFCGGCESKKHPHGEFTCQGCWSERFEQNMLLEKILPFTGLFQ